MNFGGTIRLNNKAAAIAFISLAALYLLYSWNGQGETNVETSKVSLGELLCAAITAAEAGGVEVKNTRLQNNQLNEKSKGKTKEGVKDVLTDGDMKSHFIMSKTLLNAFPNVKVNLQNKCLVNNLPQLFTSSSLRNMMTAVFL